MKLKVLVLGADTFQIGLLKWLNGMGFETHVITNRPNDPGVAFAHTCHALSYTNVEAVWQIYEAVNAVQIFSVASDASTLCQASIQQKATVSGHSPEFIQFFTDKSLYKIKLQELLPTHIPSVEVCSDNHQLVQFYRAFEEGGIVVKPRRGSGSKDISCLQSITDVMEYTWEGEAHEYLMEAFIAGKEVGGDFFCWQGKVVYYAPTTKTVNQYKVPVSHLLFNQVPEKEVITAFLQELVHALVLPDGIYNIDLIVKQSTVYLIDISPRMGGNCIPDITLLSTGVNAWQFMLDVLFNQPLSSIGPTKAIPHGVFILGVEQAALLTSTVTHTHPFGDAIVEVFWKKQKGDWVEPFTQGGKHIGYVIFKANDDEQLQLLFQQIQHFTWFTLGN